jgi:hypothetical protein
MLKSGLPEPVLAGRPFGVLPRPSLVAIVLLSHLLILPPQVKYTRLVVIAAPLTGSHESP